MLENMHFGKYHFEMGKMLLDSMLLASILVNVEVSYNLTKSDIDQFEKCHEMGLKMLLSAPYGTPKPMLYLLTGSVPIRHQIKRRRLVYLHHILNQEKDSLIRTFFERQFNTMKRTDWATQILKDLNEYEINLTMDEIRQIPEVAIIKSKTYENALHDLNTNQGSKSKKFNELKMAPYFKYQIPNEEVTHEMAKFILKIQCQMVEGVKMNFKDKYKPNLICDACNKSECTQTHLLECSVIIQGNDLVMHIPRYEEIFGDDLREQVYIAYIMKENVRRKS